MPKPTTLKTRIVNDHDRALPFIHKEIGRKNLPLKNITLLHFDAHPDFVISNEITEENIANPKKSTRSESDADDSLYSKISIESWIVPLILAGHVDKFIWVKNDYCWQIEEGEYGEVKIGFTKGHDKSIKTDLYINYFLSDDKCCLEEDLDPEATAIVNFTVLNLKNAHKCVDFMNNNALRTNSSYILDIDLDIFSTYDPFRIILGEENFSILIKIFDEDAVDENLLKKLKSEKNFQKILEFQEKHKKNFDETVGKLREIWDGTTVTVENENRILTNFVKNCKQRQELEDFETIVSAAESLVLPHHKSTKPELDKYLDQFQNFIKNLNILPKFITIARSSDDEYCPEDQVLGIEDRVLKIIEENFCGPEVRLKVEIDDL